MTRKLVPVAAIVASIAAAAPPTAAAAAGWTLPVVVSSGSSDGPANISSGKRCGSSQFGSWRLRNTADNGGVRYTVVVKPDGKLRKARKVRFFGKLPAGLERQTRQLLDTARFRYVPGATPYLDAVLPDGRLQARRPFNPTRASC